MKILHLPIKAKWFDMIESGIKLEEYRTIKRYWITRLVKKEWRYLFELSPHEYVPFNPEHAIPYDIVRLKNGYSKNARTLDIEYKSLATGGGNELWGSTGSVTFIIHLGKIL